MKPKCKSSVNKLPNISIFYDGTKKLPKITLFKSCCNIFLVIYLSKKYIYGFFCYLLPLIIKYLGIETVSYNSIIYGRLSKFLKKGAFQIWHHVVKNAIFWMVTTMLLQSIMSYWFATLWFLKSTKNTAIGGEVVLVVFLAFIAV